MAFRRLLKDGATGFYLDGKGGWTQNEKEARDFKDSQEAIKAAVATHKDNLHLVLKFSDPRMDVSHPLGKIQPSGPRRNLGKDVIITTLLPATVQAIHLIKKIVS
ncbi:MAG TPA: hypothetical protein VMZ27_03035 [Candidatus Saccharimonadales bacterium]|nr:hypothetical protein [Candidatus Saccharimonadales bacterium]